MFEAGQIFIGEYPPEAADFCNAAGNLRIDEIEPALDGAVRWQIVEIPGATDEEKAAAKLYAETSIEARITALEDALAELAGGAE